MSQHTKNKQRIVREAAALMGNRELAGRLGVSIDDVSSWILLSWSGKQRF